MEMILPLIIFTLFTTGSFCIFMSIITEKPPARYVPAVKEKKSDILEAYLKEEPEEPEEEFEINADVLDIVEV